MNLAFLILPAALAHGNAHVEHATVFHLTPGELRVEHQVAYPHGFLDLERREARRRGVDESRFAQEKKGEISSGLTMSIDGRTADRSGLQSAFAASSSGDVVQIEWRVPWTAAAHTVEWGTSNTLDEASSFAATVDPGAAYEVVASTHADGRGRHEQQSRKVTFQVEPLSTQWGWGVAAGVVVVALVGFFARRRA